MLILNPRVNTAELTSRGASIYEEFGVSEGQFIGVILVLTFCILGLTFIVWRTTLQYYDSNRNHLDLEHDPSAIGALVHPEEGGAVSVATAPTEKAAGTMVSLNGPPPDDSDMRVLDPRIRHPIFVYTLTPRLDQMNHGHYESVFQEAIARPEDMDSRLITSPNVSQWTFPPPGLGFLRMATSKDTKDGQEKIDHVHGTSTGSTVRQERSERSSSDSQSST